jgi:Domain of unknown function (DUF5666)
MQMNLYKLIFVTLIGSAGVAQAQTADLTFSINGRSVTMPLNTPVVIDDVATTLDQLRYRPNGMQARWGEAVAAANNMDGALPTPIFSFTLIGPVTQSSPIAVLGQPLTITGDTTLAGVSAPFTLPLGTPVVVAGLVDANGSILATLVERRGQMGARFLLTGQVQAVGGQPTTFQVGDQWVSAPAIAFAGCAAATPVVGEFVELRANAVTPFPPGTVLNTVTDGRCVSPVPAGTVGAAGFLQGLVTLVPAPDRFEIGSLVVTMSPTTSFVFGSLDDLDPGVAVTVDGSYVDAQTFAADVVEFVRPVVRYEAPLTPAGVTPGISLRPFSIPVLWTAQVRDEDGILANGLTQATQVEVRGYLDSSGQAYATRVRERGNPDANDVRLRGPVEAIANPFITIQGLSIDTTGDTFADEYGVTMTAPEFFAAVQIDHEVDVSGAAYNATTSTLSGGAIVHIGAEPVILPPGRAARGAAINTITAGTAGGYAFIEPMFRDGFE